jgi:hypothetical protein
MPAALRSSAALTLILLAAMSMPAAAQEYSRKPDAALFELTPISDIAIAPELEGFPAPQDRSDEVLRYRPLGDLRELRMEQGWTAKTANWQPTGFWHLPLYTEDILLERHGQRHPWVQPVCSAIHFFGSLAILPYKAGIERPWDHVYTLGYGRPGSCKRPLRRRFVFEGDAALMQAGTMIGLIVLLP